jgi:hypothetical protein
MGYSHMVTVMHHLGFSRFSVVGHDRGGRVALEGGHFFPEVIPERTADAMRRFFGRGTASGRAVQ